MSRVLLFLIVALITSYGCTSQPTLSVETKKLIKQAHAGNKQSLHKLCYGFLRGKGGLPQNYHKAFKWCNQAAEKNISSSQTLLAEMYYLGLGVNKDQNKAFHWYKKAAENGHTHAQYVLALIYLEQEGDIAKNTNKAIIWLQRSASKGHKKAQQKLQELGSKQSAGMKE